MASPLASGVLSLRDAPARAPAWASSLRDGLAALEAQALHDHSAAELGDDLRSLQRLRDRADAEIARRLAAFERRGGPAAEGSPSTVSWIIRELRLSAPEANSRLQLGRRFHELPRVTALVRSGDLGFETAAVLARTASQAGAATPCPSPAFQAEASRRVEHDLLDAARRLDPGRLRQEARSHLHRVDPNGSRDAALAAHARRRFQLAELPDGMVSLDGLLDAEAGALLATALEQLTPPPRPDDRRTALQRRADALGEMARRALDARPSATAAGRRPHLIVTLPAATLAGQPGAPGARLSTGAVVPAAVAQRMACDGVVIEVGVDHRGQPVTVSPARRTVQPSTWRALVVRDGGCVGCDRPLEWCDAHHWREPWRLQPSNRVDDLCLLCRWCHTAVHAGRLRVTRGDDGAWIIARAGPHGLAS